MYESERICEAERARRKEHLQRVRKCAGLLPIPGDSVVEEIIKSYLELDDQYTELRNYICKLLYHIQTWAAEEDGIPDFMWDNFKEAAIFVRLRASKCSQGLQVCHPKACFDLECCDHPDHRDKV